MDAIKTITDQLDSYRKSNPDEKLYAVFDFDGTCIKNDIQDILFNYMVVHDLFVNTNKSAKDIFLHYHELCEQKRFIEAYTFCAQTLCGYTEKQIFDLLDKALADEPDTLLESTLFDKKIKRGFGVNHDVIDLLTTLFNSQVDVWIVSGSPEILIKYMKTHLALPDVGVIGVRLETDPVNGLITPITIPPFSMFEGKVECIKKYIDQTTKPIFAIGDTMNDFAMIEYANIQAVKKKDNELYAVAKIRDWHILD